jgi:hypothetical protein
VRQHRLIVSSMRAPRLPVIIGLDVSRGLQPCGEDLATPLYLPQQAVALLAGARHQALDIL